MQVVDKDADAVLDEIEAAIYEVHQRPQPPPPGAPACQHAGYACTHPHTPPRSIVKQPATLLKSAPQAATDLPRPNRAPGTQVAVSILAGDGFAYDVPSRAKNNQVYVQVWCAPEWPLIQAWGWGREAAAVAWCPV